MGRGRRATSSRSSICSSSSIDSSPALSSSTTPPSPSSFSNSQLNKQLKSTDLSTDLRLGLSLSPSAARGKPLDSPYSSTKPLNPKEEAMSAAEEVECNDDQTTCTFYVKVYMEGHAIGRKLDLLAQDGFHELIETLEHMFKTHILWGDEVDGVQSGVDLHVLTYEDEEGDWLMVGDVPWEMFLSAAKRLKITRVVPC